MTISTSRASYTDCFALFDRAIESPRGIRNRCTDRGNAKHLQQRLNYARQLARRESRSIYDEASPLYDISPYDPYMVRVFEDAGSWWVYIEPRVVNGLVEELPEETTKPNPPPLPETVIKKGIVADIKRRRIA